MPDPTLSAAIEEAYASAPTDEVILDTLELRHPTFTAPLRVVRDTNAFTGKLESSAPSESGQFVVFSPLQFDVKLPDVLPNQSPEIELAIDNITGEVYAAFDAAAQSPDLTILIWRQYLASDPTTVQNDPPLTLTVRTIDVTVFRATARAGFGNSQNKRFPNDLYTVARFPGLA